MRYLILGKDGMLGHDLVHVFGDQDFIAYGKKDLNILDREGIAEALTTIQPDVVLNATGYTDVDLAEKEEEKANGINGYAVGILAKVCREYDTTLVHFSTDYVFNGTKRGGYNEEDAFSPINAYGRSKALGEKLLLDEMELLDDKLPKDGKYFIIRTSWLYGHHGKNFAATIVESARKKLLKIVNDQNGKPTFTLDLCRQVKWLLETKEYPSGIYHITNEGVTSWFEFAREILRLARVSANVVPCSSDEVPRAATRPQYSALNNTKLPPLRSWKEALKEYLDTMPRE
jgi:dTDP-4-dehydrorhamnose reductase